MFTTGSGIGVFLPPGGQTRELVNAAETSECFLSRDILIQLRVINIWQSKLLKLLKFKESGIWPEHCFSYNFYYKIQALYYM